MTPTMKTAIAANIAALADLLAKASAIAAEAKDAASQGEMNIAIGTLAEIERTTPEAASILAATFALHRLAR